MTPTELTVITDEVIGERAPWSAIVRAGDVLIVDLRGNQAVDTLFYAPADDHPLRYCAATVSAQETCS